MAVTGEAIWIPREVSEQGSLKEKGLCFYGSGEDADGGQKGPRARRKEQQPGVRLEGSRIGTSREPERRL
jgi:hypothetical protein